MTTTCRDLRPLLGAYVLGALEPEEAEAVRAHIAECPACATEHARLAPLPGLLTLATGAQQVTADPPSPALEERLLDAVARETPPPRRTRWGWRRRGTAFLSAGLAAAALAVAGVLVFGGENGGYLSLHATSAMNGARARAELTSAPNGTVMHLWLSGMPGDPKTVYEVHCDSPSWSASAGTFRVDSHGRAAVVLTTAARRGQYNRIRILRRTPSGAHVVFDAAVS